MDNQKNNFSGNDFNSDSELDLLFKAALQNHAVPTEDHVWRRIQHGLADKKGEAAPITKTIAKRSYLPIWSALSGIAASLLVWAVFFAPSDSNDINTNTIANSDKTELTNDLNKTENSILVLAENSENKKEKNQNSEATSSNAIASTKQQIPPTINKINTVSKTQKVKEIISQNPIEKAVASLEKDQTKIKNQKSQDKMNDKTFTNPSTHIADNVWASDFVVQNSDFSTKKEKNSTSTHQLNLDNQTVAITVKVGNNENMMNTSQATGFDTNENPSQFDKAKNVLKEVWNLKTGKKVNLQNILPNNEKATEKTTTNQSNQNNEIQAD
ncbi:MAG: hypothetical protein COZ18_04155 [Flexibacter sp. CG_4_10_14_3_um_filter_32_15]|nr:MAG: hypothetical protein COZ18_04155 [Flexibacter sp. CG_4_10_14_3_um_filter_32_15]